MYSCASDEGKTQMEVAEEIGISQAQVSRLEKKCTEEYEKLSPVDWSSCGYYNTQQFYAGEYCRCAFPCPYERSRRRIL